MPLRHLMCETLEAVAHTAERIGAQSTRNVLLISPPMRGYSGLVSTVVAFSDEAIAGALEIGLGTWSERPLPERDAIAHQMHRALIKALKPEFHSGRSFDSIDGFLGAAIELWPDTPVIKALQDLRVRVPL